jgi:hypothetical protein
VRRSFFGLGLAALGFGACTLNTEGEVATEPDASAGGVGGSTADSGWADTASGGAAGSGGSSADAAAGSSGQSGAAGAAGTGQCLPEAEDCTTPGQCCSARCGKAADTLDCNTADECVACNDDAQCATTGGRCDDCKCVDLELVGGSCDEPTDCLSGQCGAAPTADDKDCNDASHCVDCADDAECPTNLRCEQCECANKVGFDAACDEQTDCISGMCGKENADANDCNTNGKCVDCRGDAQCPSNESCEDCACVPKRGVGESCDEHTDCTTGDCTGGKCKAA